MARFFAFVLAMMIGIAADASEVTLVWDPPSGYEPRSYLLGYGLTTGVRSTTIDVGAARTYTVTGLAVGETYYFSVLAYSDDAASTWSNEVAVTVLPEPVPLSASVSPVVGLWGNVNEPGTGLSLDIKHGTLVVTVYSFNQDGSAQWYLALGPLVGSTFVSSLYTFTGGQCVSCQFTGPPAANGVAGTIAIVFFSARSALVYLPGGRVTEIHPTEF